MTTQEHLSRPPKVVIVDEMKIVFIPIFNHPYTGWMIKSVEPV